MDIKNTLKVEFNPNRSSGFTPTPKHFGVSSQDERGFSLIELIVVISIFVLITTITLIKHSAFNSSTVLGSLAYDIALSIRQAQVFGLAVREFKEGGSATFDTGYGIHFETVLPPLLIKSYILFADTDRQFDYDGAAELDEVFTIGRGNFISDFCATNSSNIEKCSSTGTITYLDIIFDRPDPEAIIKTNLSEIYGSAHIIVSSSNGTLRTIRVLSTGQISVE